MRPIVQLGIALSAAGLSASFAAAQTPFEVRRVGSVTTAFTTVASAPGDKSRAFALTRDGRIYIVYPDNSLAEPPFLDLTAFVTTSGGENGALGLAFDPAYQTNGYFYIAHMTPTGQTPRYVLVRYRATSPTSDQADPESRTLIMPLIAATSSPAIHNGGWIGFGPDNLLYIARGEGGSGILNVAQNSTVINGKMLRIDVRTDDFPEDPERNYAIPATNPFANSTTAAREILYLGLRNPYRSSFDRATGDLWIADVGQSQWEEVNVVRAGTPASPETNFGWPCFEAARPNNSCQVLPAHTLPDAAFPRTGSFSASCIIGGYVYRGCAIPALTGRYVFAPSCYQGRVASISSIDPAAFPIEYSFTGGPNAIYGMGEDGYGELYLCGSAGLYKIVPTADTITDCNGNGIGDACEIADGTVPDENGDGVPDTCTRLCAADADASGALNIGDVFWYLTRWFAQLPAADFNQDQVITLQDLFDYLGAYFAGCP